MIFESQTSAENLVVFPESLDPKESFVCLPAFDPGWQSESTPGNVATVTFAVIRPFLVASDDTRLIVGHGLPPGFS
jgi:hypothetical protein